MAKFRVPTNFVGEFYKLQKKAAKHITRLVKKHGNIIFYVEAQFADGEDMLYDAPRLTYIDKHNKYINYGITELTLGSKGKVCIKARNLDEDGKYDEFVLSDMTGEDIIFLADMSDKAFQWR